MPKAYQTLDDDFVQHVQANSAKGIDPFDLCKIVAWKSAQAVAEITVNSPDLIRTVTAEAWHAVRDWLDQDVVLLTQANSMDWEGYQDAANNAAAAATNPRWRNPRRKAGARLSRRSCGDRPDPGGAP